MSIPNPQKKFVAPLKIQPNTAANKKKEGSGNSLSDILKTPPKQIWDENLGIMPASNLKPASLIKPEEQGGVPRHSSDIKAVANSWSVSKSPPSSNHLKPLQISGSTLPLMQYPISDPRLPPIPLQLKEPSTANYYQMGEVEHPEPYFPPRYPGSPGPRRGQANYAPNLEFDNIPEHHHRGYSNSDSPNGQHPTFFGKEQYMERQEFSPGPRRYQKRSPGPYYPDAYHSKNQWKSQNYAHHQHQPYDRPRPPFPKSHFPVAPPDYYQEPVSYPRRYSNYREHPFQENYPQSYGEPNPTLNHLPAQHLGVHQSLSNQHFASEHTSPGHDRPCTTSILTSVIPPPLPTVLDSQQYAEGEFGLNVRLKNTRISSYEQTVHTRIRILPGFVYKSEDWAYINASALPKSNKFKDVLKRTGILPTEKMGSSHETHAAAVTIPPILLNSFVVSKTTRNFTNTCETNIAKATEVQRDLKSKENTKGKSKGQTDISEYFSSGTNNRNADVSQSESEPKFPSLNSKIIPEEAKNKPMKMVLSESNEEEEVLSLLNLEGMFGNKSHQPDSEYKYRSEVANENAVDTLLCEIEKLGNMNSAYIPDGGAEQIQMDKQISKVRVNFPQPIRIKKAIEPQFGECWLENSHKIVQPKPETSVKHLISAKFPGENSGLQKPAQTMIAKSVRDLLDMLSDEREDKVSPDSAVSEFGIGLENLRVQKIQDSSAADSRAREYSEQSRASNEFSFQPKLSTKFAQSMLGQPQSVSAEFKAPSSEIKDLLNQLSGANDLEGSDTEMCQEDQPNAVTPKSLQFPGASQDSLQIEIPKFLNSGGQPGKSPTLVFAKAAKSGVQLGVGDWTAKVPTSATAEDQSTAQPLDPNPHRVSPLLGIPLPFCALPDTHSRFFNVVKFAELQDGRHRLQREAAAHVQKKAVLSGKPVQLTLETNSIPVEIGVASGSGSHPCKRVIRQVPVYFDRDPTATQVSYASNYLEVFQKNQNALVEMRQQACTDSQLGLSLTACLAMMVQERDVLKISKGKLIYFFDKSPDKLLEEIQKLRYKPSVALVQARNELCNQGQFANLSESELKSKCLACLEGDACKFMKGLSLRYPTLSEAVKQPKSLTAQETRKLGIHHGGCSYFMSRIRVENSPVLLVPNSYLSDPVLMREILPYIQNSVLFFEEAARLLEIGEPNFATHAIRILGSELQTLKTEFAQLRQSMQNLMSFDTTFEGIAVTEMEIVSSTLENLVDLVHNTASQVQGGEVEAIDTKSLKELLSHTVECEEPAQFDEKLIQRCNIIFEFLQNTLKRSPFAEMSSIIKSAEVYALLAHLLVHCKPETYNIGDCYSIAIASNPTPALMIRAKNALPSMLTLQNANPRSFLFFSSTISSNSHLSLELATDIQHVIRAQTISPNPLKPICMPMLQATPLQFSSARTSNRTTVEAVKGLVGVMLLGTVGCTLIYFPTQNMLQQEEPKWRDCLSRQLKNTNITIIKEDYKLFVENLKKKQNFIMMLAYAGKTDRQIILNWLAGERFFVSHLIFYGMEAGTKKLKEKFHLSDRLLSQGKPNPRNYSFEQFCNHNSLAGVRKRIQLYPYAAVAQLDRRYLSELSEYDEAPLAVTEIKTLLDAWQKLISCSQNLREAKINQLSLVENENKDTIEISSSPYASEDDSDLEVTDRRSYVKVLPRLLHSPTNMKLEAPVIVSPSAAQPKAKPAISIQEIRKQAVKFKYMHFSLIPRPLSSMAKQLFWVDFEPNQLVKSAKQIKTDAETPLNFNAISGPIQFSKHPAKPQSQIIAEQLPAAAHPLQNNLESIISNLASQLAPSVPKDALSSLENLLRLLASSNGQKSSSPSLASEFQTEHKVEACQQYRLLLLEHQYVVLPRKKPPLVALDADFCRTYEIWSIANQKPILFSNLKLCSQDQELVASELQIPQFEYKSINKDICIFQKLEQDHQNEQSVSSGSLSYQGIGMIKFNNGDMHDFDAPKSQNPAQLSIEENFTKDLEVEPFLGKPTNEFDQAETVNHILRCLSPSKIKPISESKIHYPVPELRKPDSLQPPNEQISILSRLKVLEEPTPERSSKNQPSIATPVAQSANAPKEIFRPIVKSELGYTTPPLKPTIYEYPSSEGNRFLDPGSDLFVQQDSPFLKEDLAKHRMENSPGEVSTGRGSETGSKLSEPLSKPALKDPFPWNLCLAPGEFPDFSNNINSRTVAAPSVKDIRVLPLPTQDNRILPKGYPISCLSRRFEEMFLVLVSRPQPEGDGTSQEPIIMQLEQPDEKPPADSSSAYKMRINYDELYKNRPAPPDTPVLQYHLGESSNFSPSKNVSVDISKNQPSWNAESKNTEVCHQFKQPIQQVKNLREISPDESSDPQAEDENTVVSSVQKVQTFVQSLNKIHRKTTINTSTVIEDYSCAESKSEAVAEFQRMGKARSPSRRRLKKKVPTVHLNQLDTSAQSSEGGSRQVQDSNSVTSNCEEEPSQPDARYQAMRGKGQPTGMMIKTRRQAKLQQMEGETRKLGVALGKRQEFLESSTVQSMVGSSQIVMEETSLTEVEEKVVASGRMDSTENKAKGLIRRKASRQNTKQKAGPPKREWLAEGVEERKEDRMSGVELAEGGRSRPVPRIQKRDCDTVCVVCQRVATEPGVKVLAEDTPRNAGTSLIRKHFASQKPPAKTHVCCLACGLGLRPNSCATCAFCKTGFSKKQLLGPHKYK